MQWNQQVGKRAESLTIEFLHSHGFTIIQQNWHSGRYTADLIVSRQKELHFIAVHTNTNPGKAIVPIKASQRFLSLNPAWKEAIFDVLTILVSDFDDPKFFLLENVQP